MINDEALNHTQQFEQVIATVFTCRTIIKYSSSLGEVQKDEIVTELDTALQFLQRRLIANARIDDHAFIAPIPPISPLAPEQVAELLASHTMEDEDEDEDEDGEKSGKTSRAASPQAGQTLTEPMVQNLYKLYHAHLDTRSGKGMHQLETQYQQAMYLLDGLRTAVGKQPYSAAGDSIEQRLHQVKSLTSALYYRFREFAAVLASILEGREIAGQTDELSSLQKYNAAKTNQYLLRDVTPLMRTYGAHLQLQQRKGEIDTLVNDAAAFLLFLEEQMEARFPRQQEIVEQLKSVIELLHDFSSLLTGYEEALSATLTL